MKLRIVISSVFVLVLSTGIFGQDANPALGRGSTGDSAGTAGAATIEDKEYQALPVDRHFVWAPNDPGESTSRKHPFKAVADDALGNSSTVPTCAEPARLFSARDYNGPFQRSAAWFSRKPEMTTVPAHKKGKRICSLDAGEKFHLFYKTTVDPVTFVGAGLAAGFAQWNHDDKEWGQGAEGYGMRYGAAMLDRVSRNFFNKFFYPTVFHQDPRYYRRGYGSAGRRLRRAFMHTFVARSDDGNPTPNLSLWAGTVSTKALANLYHPGNSRGFGPTATRVGESLGVSMGFDVLKEFWPETVRALHLPFQQRSVVPESAVQRPATP